MESWNEIRKAATAFSKHWKDAYDDKSQAQSSLKEFFAVFGVDSVTFGYNDRSEVTSNGECAYTANSLNQYATILCDSATLRETSYDLDGNLLADGIRTFTYDAFGNTIAKSGPLADFLRHRFSTKYFDAETGLYYYGYRFYHPILMRWLTHDPIEEDGGLNLYGFCRNSSICFSDTLGKTIILTMDSNPDRKDVIKYKGKESRARGVTRRYEKFHAKASVHSSSFDSNNRNQGGQYAKYPFDTSTFKWE